MSEELFDLTDKYQAMLQQGLDFSGEDQHYFIRGRLKDLMTQLPAAWSPLRILDFGCGIGYTTQRLADLFPSAQVVGLDTSEKALIHARAHCASARISLGHIRDLSAAKHFDLCYVNGVFHHIHPGKWLKVMEELREVILPNGYLALFENNPWNLGARIVMKAIPFDRDATMLSLRQARTLLRQAGFCRAMTTRSLFYFPRRLSLLRFSESWLAGLPLGAQYYVLAQK
jgi:trans-aconitate methyltransferase